MWFFNDREFEGYEFVLMFGFILKKKLLCKVVTFTINVADKSGELFLHNSQKLEQLL